jgi:hypothetical protein
VLLVALVAAAVLGSPVTDARARASVERVLLCSASGGFTNAVAPLEGAAWTTSALSGTGWYLLADRATVCAHARGLLPELSRRSASRGTAGRVVFPLPGGWTCAASRAALQAGCSRLVKGQARYVVAIAATGGAGELTARILLDGDADARSFAPAPSSGSTPSEPARRAAPGEECSPVRGRAWSVGTGARRPEGSTWRVAAVGGLSCLAARGWVDDLTARMPGGTRRHVVDFDGGDGWRCRTSDPPLLLGVCARANGARGPLDFRGVVVAPALNQPSLRGLPLTIEEAVAAISDSRPDPRREGRPALCSEGLFPGKRWTVGSQSGTRWLIAQRGGYPCQLSLGAAKAVLLEWALAEPGTRTTAGVAGSWTCTRTPDPGLRCFGFGAFSRFKLALTPYLPDRTHQRNVDAAVAAAR